MLPANTLSHLQQMDAGIIKNVKVHHKGSNLAKHNVLEIDEKGSFDRLDLKQAIYFVKDSWNAVISNTITNCFCHVKIIPTVNNAHLVEVTEEQHLQADIDRMNLQSPLSAAEFLDVDATEETESPLTEDDISQLGQVDEHVDSLDQLDTTHPPQVALKEGIHHAHLFLAPLEQHEAFGEEEYAPIRKIMDRMHTALVPSAIQTKISDFFKPAYDRSPWLT